jgi:hypothetical protein
VSTEVSVCQKTCDASKPDGSGDQVTCTGFCRCEPTCGGQCEATCCRLAFELHPPRCSVLRYDCQYRQTFMEHAECTAAATNNRTNNDLCICRAGYCGINISDDGHMVCGEGLGAPCMPCPRGSYKSLMSLAACELCRPGYSTLRVGATNKQECKPLCKNGSSSETGFEVCHVCGVVLPCASVLSTITLGV